MALLILMRHGLSLWNEYNLFTGWVDIPLSLKGIEEALAAGEKIKDLPIDVIFTSMLVRAQETAFLTMSKHSSGKVPMVLHPGEGKLEEWSQIYNPKAAAQVIPVYRSWELNERMYGKLQGLNKAETIAQYGPEQVQIWRRSYDVPPPDGESLKDTAARAIPYYEKEILPFLKQGKNVFVCAHGNSLRSIVMAFEGLSEAEVLKLEIATGDPLLYTYEQGTMRKFK